MKIPYIKKSRMNVRSWIRTSVPWIFGKFSMYEDRIVINYFFFSKVFDYKRMTSKVYDDYLEVTMDRATFQIYLPNADEVNKYINQKK